MGGGRPCPGGGGPRGPGGPSGPGGGRGGPCIPPLGRQFPSRPGGKQLKFISIRWPSWCLWLMSSGGLIPDPGKCGGGPPGPMGPGNRSPPGPGGPGKRPRPLPMPMGKPPRGPMVGGPAFPSPDICPPDVLFRDCISNWLRDCLLQGVTMGFCPCSSRLASRSSSFLEDASEPTHTRANPLLCPLALFSKNLISSKSLMPIDPIASVKSSSVVHHVRLPMYRAILLPVYVYTTLGGVLLFPSEPAGGGRLSR